MIPSPTELGIPASALRSDLTGPDGWAAVARISVDDGEGLALVRVGSWTDGRDENVAVEIQFGGGVTRWSWTLDGLLVDPGQRFWSRLAQRWLEWGSIKARITWLSDSADDHQASQLAFEPDPRSSK